ncbi:MAG: phenylalanine--tRNA ligase subunit alpha [Candidatus Phytoplasma stylosanthis]|nr:phenylalanine--tRNA ligase subunit alpha [Candidatus Phytoplasma stylosanthis]
MYSKLVELDKILSELEKKFILELEIVNDKHKLSQLETIYMGKEGYFCDILKQLKKINNSVENQKEFKKKIYLIKQKINNLLKEKQNLWKEQILFQKLTKEKTDISLPHFQFPQGSIHPLNQIIKQIENFFLGLGYFIHEGNEIETDLYNFELLNMDKEHPSRDMQDSFYLDMDSEKLLRTHTSSSQIRTMLQNKNKFLKMISFGKVYRRDKEDDTHSHQFTQLEGLVIDDKINLIDLKTTIDCFIKHIFGKEQEIRFRPSYFPFTRPSFEVDLILIDKKQNKKYLEILGAGLVHPKVLSNGGFDSKKYKGIAFGLGIERIAMIKHKIKNIRDFYNNDLRFLNQFI